MAFDSRSGFCLTGGPPGPAAPFAPQLCFQPAYVPNGNVGNNAFSWDALRCQANGDSVGGCSFSEECGPGGTCNAGNCLSINCGPMTYNSGNPKIVKSMPWEQVNDMMKAMGMEQTFQEFAKYFAFGKSMFLVEHQGQTIIATPLNVQYFRQDPHAQHVSKQYGNVIDSKMGLQAIQKVNDFMKYVKN